MDELSFGWEMKSQGCSCRATLNKGRQENVEVESDLLRGGKKKPEHLWKCFCRLDPTRWKQTERRSVPWEDFLLSRLQARQSAQNQKREIKKLPQ